MLKFTKLTQSTTLVRSKRPEIWKCNALIIDCENASILIDCNFNEPETSQLLDFLHNPAVACYITHTHIDHVNHLHFLAGRGVPIYAPEPENLFLSEIDLLLLNGGAEERAMRTEMKDYICGDLGFKEIEKVISFVSGTTVQHANITIESIPLPGHSPGHTGFLITDCKTQEKVLFVADIGLDDFGAWYGFAYCDLTEYRKSLSHLNNLYKPRRQILLSSHGNPHFHNNPGNLGWISDGIDKTEKKLLRNLSVNPGKTVAELTFTGLYYPLSSIGKMPEKLKKLYNFWEYWTLKNHLLELEKNNVVKQQDNKRWQVC